MARRPTSRRVGRRRLLFDGSTGIRKTSPEGRRAGHRGNEFEAAYLAVACWEPIIRRAHVEIFGVRTGNFRAALAITHPVPAADAM